MNQHPQDIVMNTGAAALPVVAWLSNISTVLTAVAALMSISWFIRLWYLSLKKDKNV